MRPKIEIWAESRAGECVINVRDNGTGFSPAYSDRILLLFKHLHEDADPGRGLGVDPFRQIVERCGANIFGATQEKV